MSAKSTGKALDQTNLKRLDTLTEEEIEEAARSDEDSLLLEECDINSLQIVMPKAKQPISLRVDPDVLSYFKSMGKGYQTRMNAVLRAYMKGQLNQS